MGWDEVSITDLEVRVSPEILARGQEYQQTGHILRACRFNGILAGEAAGTGGTYRIRLIIGETGIDGDCTCPYPGFCKHMVALSLAWIEKSSKFIILDPNLNEVNHSLEDLHALLIQLVQKDPLNFLDLISTVNPEKSFLNTRGVLNLIRNTFQGQSLTHEQIEALWERIKRIEKLVAEAIAKQEKDALELLRELLKGVAYSYKDYREPLLKNTFDELLIQTNSLPEGWTEDEILRFAQTLWEIYFDYSLWELSDSVRPVLLKLHSKSSDWLFKKLETVKLESLNQTELISFHELLALVSENGPVEAEYFKKVIRALNQRPEGQLWMIDRIMEENPNWAFTLAKEGLKNSREEDRQAFRERLIEIHLVRGENKQAAALSFIQFQEKANLQEYLRLKAILVGHRSELENYLDKMDKAIGEQGLPILAVRIAFDQENWTKLKEQLGKIDPAEVFLKELAELINADSKLMPLEIFQSIIIRLLMGGRSNWEIVLRLVVKYKKVCLKNSRNEEWSEFRVRLNTEYGEDQRFVRKFGAVLAG